MLNQESLFILMYADHKVDSKLIDDGETNLIRSFDGTHRFKGGLNILTGPGVQKEELSRGKEVFTFKPLKA